MLSFQQQYTKCQKMSQDNGDEALVFFKDNINVGQQILEAELGSFYTEETYTDLTETDENSYPTPDQFVRLKIAYVTSGGVRYIMREIHDEEKWQIIQASQVGQTSDTATHIIVRRDRFQIYPTPASDDNVITLIHEASGKDLSFADYTDGTITTLTNEDTAVTASGTTFTAAMAGRYFKIDAFPVWYKIASFGTTTTLTLDKPYQGLSIAAGTEDYTIGEMPRTPSTTHHIPVWYALMNYYGGFKQNTSKMGDYRTLYQSDLKKVKVTYGKRYSSNYIKGNRSRLPYINPNHYPVNMGA